MKPVIDKLRTQRWYNNELHGVLHRDNDLPAVITENGTHYWYINGKRHRLYKPAVINADGIHYWYINGNDITEEVDDFIKEHDLPHWSEWTEVHRILFRMRF